MKFEKTYTINTIEQWEEILNEIFPLIQKTQAILLDGNLGAGKTTFVKMLGKKIGIKQNITSPSFSYMKDYPGLIHIDLYNYKGDLEEFEDYFEGNIVAIEWASLKKIDSYFDSYIQILINNDNNVRQVIVKEK